MQKWRRTKFDHDNIVPFCVNSFHLDKHPPPPTHTAYCFAPPMHSEVTSNNKLCHEAQYRTTIIYSLFNNKVCKCIMLFCDIKTFKKAIREPAEKNRKREM